MAKVILRSIVSLFIAIAAAVTVRTAMWSGPMLTYAVAPHSVRAECDAIHTGMTLSQVQKLFQTAMPTSEAVVGNHLSFEYRGSCEVQLDHSTRKTMSARFQEATYEVIE
jgi:hypothetical protein